MQKYHLFRKRLLALSKLPEANVKVFAKCALTLPLLCNGGVALEPVPSERKSVMIFENPLGSDLSFHVDGPVE